ncbi:deoxyribonuclease IV [Patescibacteria group bacterium]
MKIGLHISIAGGIENAPKRAKDLGCECFQMFSRSPRGGGYNVALKEEAIKKFKNECKKYSLIDYYIHSPYYINFASANNKIFFASVTAIKKELETANLIGAKAVVTHLGSAKDLGEKMAIKKTAEGISMVLEKYNGNAKLLLEISAGSGNIIGDSFDDIAQIIKKNKNSKYLGVCFDTAHAFASGYDLTTAQRIKNVFTEFNKKIGLKKLQLIHLNDSKSELNSHIDRHENIGEGKIGMVGLQSIVDFAKRRDLNIIVELADGKLNLERLSEIRGGFYPPRLDLIETGI